MSSPRAQATPKRTRRSAEDARRAILDAAERRLTEHGPDGIRLQQIAADVGISHPAVLHHFRSREGLVEAVVTRAFSSLEADLIRSIAEAPLGGDSALFSAIEQAFSVLVAKGHGRVMSWLLLSGHSLDTGPSQMRALVEIVHQRRVAAQPAGDVDFEDSAFRVMLVTLSFLGESVAGPTLRKSLGIDDADDQNGARFRGWLVRLLTPPELR